MYVRNNINLLTRGSTFVEWPIVQRTRDNFHQNAAHTRQTQIEQRTRGKFQESGMPECPNRMPECPNRTAHFISRMLKSNRLPSLLGKSCNDPSVSNESTWFLSEDMWMTPTDFPTEEILKWVSAAQNNAVEAKCHKDRRDSRGFDAIRRHLHTRNAANQLRES